MSRPAPSRRRVADSTRLDCSFCTRTADLTSTVDPFLTLGDWLLVKTGSTEPTVFCPPLPLRLPHPHRRAHRRDRVHHRTEAGVRDTLLVLLLGVMVACVGVALLLALRENTAPAPQPTPTFTPIQLPTL